MKNKAEIIAFIRGLAEDDVLVAEIDSLIDGFSPPYVKGAERPKMKKPAQPQFVEGAINPAFLVELRDIAISFSADWQRYYGRQWPGFKEQIATVNQLAKQAGIDLSSYAPDTFSLGDITHLDDVFAATENQLKTLAARIKTSHEYGLEIIDEAKKKHWAMVLLRARTLQKLCQDPVPKTIKNHQSKKIQEVWRYLHPLRYMLYTTRSHLMTTDGTLEISETPNHLVMACLVMKIARAHAASMGIDGVLLVLAPRHGKTTLAICDTALSINMEPYLNHGIVHHSSKHATSRFLTVRDHFLDTDVGRRRAALFPHIRLDGSNQKNNTKMFVLDHGKRTNQHQEGCCSPWGVHSKAQGLTFHHLLFDDPSDEKEQAEEGTRQRTNHAISSTWMPRLTGRAAFFTYICTRWHPEDFCGTLLDLVKKDNLNLAYYSVACGGPDDDFAPIWPEAGYDEDYLESAFARLGPVEYACQYQNDPDSPQARKVKQLRFYDAKEWLDEQSRSDSYKRFFDDPATKFYLSVDPSGTASKHSNLAGITYAAFGPFRTTEDDGSIKDVLKLKFLKFWSLHASQLDIAEVIAKFERENKVDFILVESTSGFHATSEALIAVHGIKSTKVIKKPPGRGSKIERLLNYAIHLEAGDAEFPGEWTRDEHDAPALKISKDWQPLALQLLRAGTTKDDNLLDCVRQQLEEVSPDIYTAKKMPNPFKESPTVSKRRRFFEDLDKKKRLARQRNYRRPRNPIFARRKYVDNASVF